MKTVLIISPTPSHPQNAGNRARIFSFVEEMKKNGYIIHFLYVNMEGDPNVEMIKYWGDFLHVTNTNRNTGSIKTKTLFEKVLYKVGLINNEKYKYNFHIDDWFDDKLLDNCIELNNKFHFEIVLTEYVFMSKALTVFPESTLKIIDTHDCFTDRYKIFPLDTSGNRTSKWFSTYKYEEKKGLQRADRIIAIQKNEEIYLKKLVKKPVTTIGHLIEPEFLQDKKFTKNILFFGSSNPINVDAYYFFVEKVWPLIKLSLPDCKFIVAGLICNVLEKRDDIEYLGEVIDKREAYNSVSVSVNPMTYGSGLKIKTLESLIYGIPVVSTTHGAIGLEDMIDKCIFVADKPEVIVDHIVSLLNNEELYNNAAESTKIELYEYQKTNTKNIIKILSF